MRKIGEIKVDGIPIYYLKDHVGSVWLGGWRNIEVAKTRLEQAEACNWDLDLVDREVEVELDENGTPTSRCNCGAALHLHLFYSVRLHRYVCAGCLEREIKSLLSENARLEQDLAEALGEDSA